MKLLTAEYDYTTETAQVELSHKGKIYKGSAHYKEEDKNSYFKLSPEAFEYSHNNKNILYKSDGLLNIF